MGQPGGWPPRQPTHADVHPQTGSAHGPAAPPGWQHPQAGSTHRLAAPTGWQPPQAGGAHLVVIHAGTQRAEEVDRLAGEGVHQLLHVAAVDVVVLEDALRARGGGGGGWL